MPRNEKTKEKRDPDNLTLCDSEGRPRIIIGFFGEDEAATIQMADANQLPRLVLQVESNGNAVVSLTGSKEMGKAGIGANADGSVGFGMSRPNGVPLFRMNWTPEQGLDTYYFDDAGRVVWHGRGPLGGTAPPESSNPSD